MSLHKTHQPRNSHRQLTPTTHNRRLDYLVYTMASSSSFTATHPQQSLSPPSKSNDKMENLSQFETCYRACLELNDPTPDDLVVRSRSWLSSISEKELKCFIKTILKPPECKDEPNQVRLRHVQLQVLLRLQLLLLQEQVFLQRYIKISKVRRKSQTTTTTPTNPPQNVLLDDMIRILSTAAFLLDQNRPFAQFLTTILTKHLYTGLPDVVSALLDAFEISNPYLPKPKEDMELGPVLPVKRKKRKLPAASQQAQAPPKRLPLTSKKNRFQGSHFHANHKLDAISKLLDATPKATMAVNRTKSANITPQSMPSSKHSTRGRPNRLLSSQKTSQTTKSKSKSALLQQPPGPKSSPLNHEPQHEHEQLRQTVVQETPPSKSCPRPRHHREVQETLMFHSPVRQQRHSPHGIMVQETPVPMSSFHSPVSQSRFPTTPPRNNRSSVQEALASLSSLNNDNNNNDNNITTHRSAPETPAAMDLETTSSTTTTTTTKLRRLAPESPAMRNNKGKPKPFLSSRPGRPMNLFG